MRNVVVLLLLVFAAVSCKEKPAGRFTVEGNIKNTNAKKVYLQEVAVATGALQVIDSAEVKNGVFKLDATSKEEGFYYLRFDDMPRPFASFINDATVIKVSGDMQPGSDIGFEGSKASNVMKDFYLDVNKKWLSLSMISQKIDSLVKAQAADSLVNKTDAEAQLIVKEIKDKVKEIVLKGNSAVLAIIAIQGNQNLYSPDEYSNMLRLATETYPLHAGLQSVRSKFEQQLAAARQVNPQKWTGKPAPEISLPDVNGKMVSLSAFKGKYVLVDFWASWCKPCRLENPNVVAAYKNFKDKNFTVLGVSLDENKNAWLKAIEKDGLTWTHISDLKQWNSSVVPLYMISGIPFNVLVDPQGVIVAENLRGYDLQSKLRELLN